MTAPDVAGGDDRASRLTWAAYGAGLRGDRAAAGRVLRLARRAYGRRLARVLRRDFAGGLARATGGAS